jgi:hypothetical protein
MIAKKTKVVFDLYMWLPHYGETRIEFTAKDRQLEVAVFYDNEADSESSKTITFSGVAWFMVSAVPGVEITKCNYDGIDATGSLIEFEHSEAALMWQNCLPWRDKIVRHYQVFFLSENKRLEVFAEECCLSK